MKDERYCSSVMVDKYLLYKDPDYGIFMTERLWDSFKDKIIAHLVADDSIIVEKIFDVQRDFPMSGQIEKRQDILIKKLTHCKDCRWGKEVCGNIECTVDPNVPPEYHGYEWYCPSGERKEKEC